MIVLLCSYAQPNDAYLNRKEVGAREIVYTYWFHNVNFENLRNVFHLRTAEANLNVRDCHIDSLDTPCSKLGKTNSIQLHVNSLPNRDVSALV